MRLLLLALAACSAPVADIDTDTDTDTDTEVTTGDTGTVTDTGDTGDTAAVPATQVFAVWDWPFSEESGWVLWADADLTCEELGWLDGLFVPRTAAPRTGEVITTAFVDLFDTADVTVLRAACDGEAWAIVDPCVVAETTRGAGDFTALDTTAIEVSVDTELLSESASAVDCTEVLTAL